MKIKPIIQSQYLASLAMLKHAIVKCPPKAWNNPHDKNRFWFLAYHALYYAHRYLKAQEEGYPRWEQRRYSQPGVPFSKEEILERCALVEQDVIGQIGIMNLDQTSGSLGLSNKLELQLYNIRHIQQHAGELYEKLSAYQNIKLGWVDQRSGPRRIGAASLKEKKK
jgi:hypothetical protein